MRCHCVPQKAIFLSDVSSQLTQSAELQSMVMHNGLFEDQAMLVNVISEHSSV